MNQNNEPTEELDRYFPNFQNFKSDRVNSESNDPSSARSNPTKFNQNRTRPKIELKEKKKIPDRFFLYIFSASIALGFLGTIVPKKSIEQTLDIESGERIEIMTSKQGDTFTQVVGYSLASLAAIMGSIKKLVSK
ncbi:hypothetical protein IQ235_10405 [Oscillatoriales cyanobacterium LEGE 11467]|uniref:Uncharacterized protein n=1 Tax=Zarconia navalis LEGE 11467 TaxID=1828826 RepID=A0A928VX47_9CYAN|nr:hypothetical protein [Zarconia navalis]MBE9041189.1 hypothetical protein [Zarconia navalis LEGE 11467]